ncbi:MAG: AAA family ATPase [Candidatus Binatia bacterium]
MPDPGSSQPSIVLDLTRGSLRVGDRPVALRPKTWEVLCALIERSGQLVTKEELLDRVWVDTAVTEGILSKSIGELRAALDDSKKAPRCIETVPRRGFRWIASARIISRDTPQSGTRETAAPAAAAVEAVQQASIASAIIGRDAELGRLAASLARARTGKRQLVFVTGEAGAGKTMLIDSFLEDIARGEGNAAVMIAHGQCPETSGAHEPYLPLLDAFERLARDRQYSAAVTTALRRWAPTWVSQMLSLSDTERVASTTAAPLAPGSMLRELATAVDEIARDRTLVLVVEDAHWADLASTDACGTLAKRRDPARLLVIVTKRNAEAVVLNHPIVALRRDLVARQMAEELALQPFGRATLLSYLATRCPGLEEDDAIVECLLHQTAGNPLFVRLLVDEWIAREMIAVSAGGAWTPTGDAQQLRNTVPESLRELLERQIRQLAPGERAVLEAASVRVGEFHAASIAAAIPMDGEEVDSHCERIARRGQLLRACGRAVASDGMLAEKYAFLHATVQNVMADGLSWSKRQRLHRAAAEQLEREHAGRTLAGSALLAAHYEAAGDAALAIMHLRESGRQAMQRDAPRDAIVKLERVLGLIDANPALPDPDAARIATLSYLSHARQLAYGFVDPQVIELWSRTSELATSKENAREQILADSGRIIVACVSGRYTEAEEVIRSALSLSEHVDEIAARKTLYFAAGTTRYRIAAMGDACAIFETALSLEHEHEPVPGADLTALLMSQYAPAVSLSGRPDYVRRLVRESVERSIAYGHYSECVTGTLCAWALCLLHDFTAAAPIAARALEIAEIDSFRTWSTRPLIMLGLAAIDEGRFDEGAAQIREGMEGRKHDGQMVDHSAMCCLYAERMMDCGHDGAEEFLEEAAEFVASSGELYAESEILRLRAKAKRLGGGNLDALEPLLRRALDLANLRGIHWHGLLAATDFASLLLQQGRHAEAQTILEPACAAIAGGAELAAVRRGNELLAAIRLGGGPGTTDKAG